jgi:hypothetical protein
MCVSDCSCFYIRRYGYHITVTSYFVNRDPVATVRFFNNIRYGNADGADDEQLKVCDVCLHVSTRCMLSIRHTLPACVLNMCVI